MEGGGKHGEAIIYLSWLRGGGWGKDIRGEGEAKGFWEPHKEGN